MAEWDVYERSAAPSSFEEFEFEDTFVAWMDILGVRQKSHAELIRIVDDALSIAQQQSSTGAIFEGPPRTFVGTPQTAVQYTLVGDALVLVEKNRPETRNASTLGLIYRVTEISRMLFQQGYPHRCAITKGPVKCFLHEGTPIITGTGVVRAVALEATIKGTGVYFDEKCVEFLRVRGEQLGRLNGIHSTGGNRIGCRWRFIAPNLTGVIWGANGHAQSWADYALNMRNSHKYVARSHGLIGKLRKIESSFPR